MSYLVIARKYRPSTFDDVVGQTHVTKTLKNAIASERTAHAYLFSGPRGVGKTSIARILAKSLNCTEGPTATPCGKCSICEGITKGSHVDVFEIDGASNTGVDNIREIRESVKYMPAEARFKIYIIDEVHMLSTGAFNALLKTLEEPPEHVKFIFATTETHKVPATITSRCQQFDFKRIAFKELEGHLRKITDAEKITIDDQSLYLITREAEGSLRDAQSYLDQVIAFSGDTITSKDVVDALGIMDREVLLNLIESIRRGDGKECLTIVESIYGFGGDFKRITADLLDIVRAMTVLKVTGTGENLDLPASEVERLGTINEGFTVDSLQMLFNMLMKGYDDVGRSSSPRYAFEMLTLKASMIGSIEPIQDVINRVARLKAIGATSGQPASGQVASPAPVASPPTPVTKASPVESKPKVENSVETKEETPAQEVATSEPSSSPAIEPVSELASTPAPPHKGSVTDFIAGKVPSIASPVRASSATLNNGAVTFKVANENFGIISTKKAKLKELCSEFYGRAVNVEIEKGGEAKETIQSSPPEMEEGEMSGESSAPTSSPPPSPSSKSKDVDTVRSALNILGGKVIDERRRDS